MGNCVTGSKAVSVLVTVIAILPHASTTSRGVNVVRVAFGYVNAASAVRTRTVKASRNLILVMSVWNEWGLELDVGSAGRLLSWPLHVVYCLLLLLVQTS